MRTERIGYPLSRLAARYPDRYVLDTSEPAPLTQDGLLDLRLATAASVRPTAVRERAGLGTSFAILAPGGVGKTFVFQMLGAIEDTATHIDLGILSRSEINQSLSAAIDRGEPIYIDRLDEAVLWEPALFRLLNRHLRNPRSSRIAWRFACRPTAWDLGFARLLEKTLPQYSELRLLPLTIEAARQLLVDNGFEASEFLQALSELRLTRLAATPMQLLAAASQWTETRYLPRNYVEAMTFEVDHLLRETDPSRRPHLAINQQRSIARRLGAFSIFCGAGRFTRHSQPGHAVLPVMELPATPDQATPSLPIFQDQYEEVLGSALFDAAGDAAVAFRHQQYAEFLAASYLKESSISRRQLQNLLGADIDGIIPSEMIGVAAWVAVIDPELAEDSIASNALAIAQSGVQLPSERARACVIDGLLREAAAGGVDIARRMDLSHLVYDGLERQLVEQFEREDCRPEFFWWLFVLATAGQYASILPRIVRKTLSPVLPTWIRRAGIRAVASLSGNSSALESLKGLLRLGEDTDPYDELLAGALSVLYPVTLSTSEMLEVLKPKRHDHLIDYDLMLEDLPSRIPRSDLAEVVEWSARRALTHSGDYGRFFVNMIQRMWKENLTDTEIDGLAELLVSLGRTGESWRHGERLPWMGVDHEDRRRDILVCVCMRLSAGQWYLPWDLALCIPDDAMWLIEHLPEVASPACDVLVQCLPFIVERPSADVADRILSLPECHPAFDTTLSLRGATSLESELAKQMRQQRVQQAQFEAQKLLRNRERLTNIRRVLRDAADAPELWWEAAYLVGADGPKSEPIFSHDLTKRPGWTSLGPDEKEGLLAVSSGFGDQVRVDRRGGLTRG